MKQYGVVLLVAVLGFCLALGQDKATLKTTKEKVSYSIGVNLGKNFQMQGIDIDVKLLTRGIQDVLANKKTAMSDKEIETTMMDFQKEMMTKMEAKKKIDSQKNKKASFDFLEENKKKEGVVALPDGLQYKVITMGNGPKPTVSDTVKVHYRGTLIDGSEFESSYKQGKPIEFPVGGVIRGWTEALQMMPVGSKWQLFIPSDLAYGDNGAGGKIGPGATLIFEVELLGIRSAK